MQRLRDIEVEFQRQRRGLEAAYRALEAACGHDAGLFSDRWRDQAGKWHFEPLKELILGKNAWYPVEGNLPMDPRKAD